MKMMLRIVALIIIFGVTYVHAKRKVQEQITPITAKNIIFSVPVFVPGENQNGGFIEARNKDNNNLVWRLKVYNTEYALSLEKDVQDIFITSLELEGEFLMVIDEKGRVFSININTKAIIMKNNKN